MKKIGKLLFISFFALLLIGCPGVNGTKDTSLTGKINETGDDIDLENVVFTEDAEVTVEKKISNLNIKDNVLTVNVSGVTLENVTAKTVIAGAKIGEGDLTIVNCNIKTLTVLGGGDNSIHVKGTKVEKVSVEKEAVRLALEESTELGAVSIAVTNVKIEAAPAKDAAKAPKITTLKIEDSEKTETSNIQIKNAVIAEVEVEKKDVVLKLEDSTSIASVKVAADNTSIQATAADSEKAPVIETVKVESTVKAVEVSGGKIEKIEVKAENATAAVPDIKITGAVEIAEITKVDNNDKVVEGAEITVIVTDEVDADDVVIPETVEKTVITLESVVIDTNESNQNYKEGDLFNYSGIYAIYTYSDKSTKKVALTKDNCTVTGFDSAKEGLCKVTIKYEDVTTTFNAKIAVSGYKFELKDYYWIFNSHNDEFIDYNCFTDITSYFKGVLPEEGEKVTITIKGTSSEDINNLWADLLYEDKNGKYQVLDAEDDVLIAQNIKKGEEFSVTASFTVTKKVSKIILQTFIFDVDYKGLPVIENGAGVPAATEMFKAKSVENGVAVTITVPDGYVCNPNNNFAIHFLGNKAYMQVNNKAGGTFVYPFVEKGKTYYLKCEAWLVDALTGKNETYLCEYIKVANTTAGLNLKDYVKDEDKLTSIKPTARYDSIGGKIYVGFTADFTKADEIFNFENVQSALYDYASCIGEKDWSKTLYIGGGNLLFKSVANDWENDGKEVKLELGARRNWNFVLDALKLGKTTDIDSDWYTPLGATDSAKWSKYGNKYFSYFNPYFTVAGFDDISFYYDTINSDYYTYDPSLPSTKNTDFDKAFKDEIAEVENFIDSEAELLGVIEAAYKEYYPLFAENKKSSGRSTVAPAKSVAEAYAQIGKIINWVNENSETISKLMKSDKFALKFDEAINIDELSLEEWVTLIGRVYDDVMIATYGAVDAQVQVGTSTHYVRETYEYEYEWRSEPWYTDELGNMHKYQTYDGDGNYGFYKFSYKEITAEEYDKYFIDYDDYDNVYFVWSFDEEKQESSYKYYGYTIEGKTIIPARTETYPEYEYIKSFSSEIRDLNNHGTTTFQEIVKSLDKYVSIKKLYLALMADIDIETKKINSSKTEINKETGKEETIEVKSFTYSGEGYKFDAGFATEMGIVDINAFLTEGFGAEKKFTLPVKGASIAVDIAAKADVTADQISALEKYVNDEKDENGKLPEVEVNKGELNSTITLKAAVCTSESVGGIITAKLTVASDNVIKICADLSKLFDDEGNEPDEAIPVGYEVPVYDGEEYGNEGKIEMEAFFTEDMFNLLSEICSVEISVSDGNVNTFEKEYTATELLAMFMPVE